MATNDPNGKAKQKLITLLVIWVVVGIGFTLFLAVVGGPVNQPVQAAAPCPGWRHGAGEEQYCLELEKYSLTEALSVGWHLPNFLILVTILWYFGRGPLKEHLVQRRAALAEAIAEADRQRLEAEDRHQEYQEKLERIGEELAALKRAMQEEAEREKERILAAAQEESARIKNEAEFTARQELSKARAALREEAAALTVELAEKLLRQVITDQDQERILREYLERVELKP